MEDISLSQQKNTISYTQFFLIWFTVMCFWWLSLAWWKMEDTPLNHAFGLVFGLIPLLGGMIGLKNAIAWGGRKSVMGRATGLLSLGLISWAIGGLIWAYYNFFGAVDVPYPSFADLAYLISWPLWTIGAIELSKATGAQFSLRKRGGKLILLIVPLVVAALSYYLLVTVARGGYITEGLTLVKTFFDLAYPIGDVVILSFVLVIYGLSMRYFGGHYLKSILLLLGGFVV